MFEAGPEIFMGQHALGRTAPGKGIEGSCGIEIRAVANANQPRSRNLAVALKKRYNGVAQPEIGEGNDAGDHLDSAISAPPALRGQAADPFVLASRPHHTPPHYIVNGYVWTKA